MAEAKTKAEVTMVKMEDGREVGFAGKRRLIKEVLIDDAGIEYGDGVVQISEGAIKGRYDFRDGSTRTFSIPLKLLAQFAGHGQLQKYGDELASPADKPLSEADMVQGLEDLDSQIQQGLWRAEREGGGGAVSGASIVVKALMEVTKLDAAAIKAFLQKKMDQTPELTRPALYAAFRADPKVKEVIRRLEDEKEAKNSKIDASAALSEMVAQ